MGTLRKISVVVFAMSFLGLVSCSDNRKRELTIIVTTDVHGSIFSTDPASDSEINSSMSAVSTYVNLTELNSEVLLLDNGDNLQGNPSIYYYNFIDTSSVHLWSRVLNYIGYDALTVGNHDIEAGHNVYDRIRREYKFPMLAANAISTQTGKPYFEPYTIIKKNGLRIAVFGLITPGVPGWLPEILYEGIEFEDMVRSAQKWMPEIMDNNPDLIIGLFHSGWDDTYGGGSSGSYLNENASLAVAREVEGFDLIFIGHDHGVKKEYVLSNSGDSVLILDNGSYARYLGVAEISYKGRGNKKRIQVSGDVIRTDTIEADNKFNNTFKKDFEIIKDYVNRPIGVFTESISSRDAYFGNSPFVDLIHQVQLDISGADISFAAPLSYDVEIQKGNISVSDMFKLYRYENMLYTIELSGEEIDNYLEYSYGLWINEMKDIEDDLFLYNKDSEIRRFKNRSYNFDSSSGIDYTVDLRKPVGNKVDIISFSDGREFDVEKVYKVTLNSYRGSGGGGHLTAASGLDQDQLKTRLIESTDLDLRFYMINWIEEMNIVEPIYRSNWKLVPVDWVNKKKEFEYNVLFK